MGKKDKEDKKDSEDHNVHALLGQPALVQIVDRGLPGKSDQEKKVTTTILAMCVSLQLTPKSHKVLPTSGYDQEDSQPVRHL